VCGGRDDDAFDVNAAYVVCQQLGYRKGEALPAGTFGAASKSSAFSMLVTQCLHYPDEPYTPGSFQTSLMQCSYGMQPTKQQCGATAAVRCS